MRSFFADVYSGLRSLAFPIRCVSCDLLGANICNLCIQPWLSHAVRSQIMQTPLWTAVPYSESVARVVLRAKENQNPTAQLLIADVFARLIVESTKDVIKKNHHIHLRIIPIPSSHRANRRRGGEFLAPIIEKALEIIEYSRGDFSVEVASILKQRRGVRDQSGLSQRERARNMDHSIALHEMVSWPNLEGTVNILLDDVITTGSTLQNALRVLYERNVTIHTAITACASQRRLALR